MSKKALNFIGIFILIFLYVFSLVIMIFNHIGNLWTIAFLIIGFIILNKLIDIYNSNYDKKEVTSQ